MGESPGEGCPSGVRPVGARARIGRLGPRVIKNYVHAWRVRGMADAKRRIGAIVLSDSAIRMYSGVELRERTGLRRGVLYRTLDGLTDARWLGVEPAILNGRRQNCYFITGRGAHLFAALLADHDIHSGDNSCRQVWGIQCVSNAWTSITSRSSVRPGRR
jgi:hypothetical protein